MWIPIGQTVPQNNWVAWHPLPQVASNADRMLVKISFSANSFASIFSSCYVRIKVDSLVSIPVAFKIQEAPTLYRFQLFPELGQNLQLECKWKWSRNTREPAWQISIDRWQD